ncbi:hypothetical protein ACFYSC_22160 [Streptosporangium sp. NPDC004379]
MPYTQPYTHSTGAVFASPYLLRRIAQIEGRPEIEEVQDAH